jgi:chromosome segregation ATPase
MNTTIVIALIGSVSGVGALILGVLNIIAGRGGQRATEAKTLTDTSMGLLTEIKTEYAEVKTEYAEVKKKCDTCIGELKTAIDRADAAEERAVDAEKRAEQAERRADRNDRTNSALIDAWTAALPLLAADAEATKYLRATIRVARESRYADEP